MIGHEPVHADLDEMVINVDKIAGEPLPIHFQ